MTFNIYFVFIYNYLHRAVTGKYRFLLKSIIRSAVFFLVVTLIWTLLSEALTVVKDIVYFKHWPLITNFQLECQENDPNSPLFKDEKNSDNDYVTKSSKRYELNIHEATKETLSTINIQVAVWIYMATHIEQTKGSVGVLLTITKVNELSPAELSLMSCDELS